MEADSDTTLLVQDPNGNWLCDDDTAENLNPGLRIVDPAAGRYAVWAGRFSRGPAVPATIYVSELGFLGEYRYPRPNSTTRCRPITARPNWSPASRPIPTRST